MKLEFLGDGSPDCPLIRIYAFEQPAVLKLRDLVNSLAAATKTSVPLDKQPWIEPVGGCELELCLAKRDRGIIQAGPSRFECVLSHEGWLEIAGLLEPFCESNDLNAYQWLSGEGKISLLLSSSGSW